MADGAHLPYLTLPYLTLPYLTLPYLTFLAALRTDRITAPWLLDGPINGECLRTYVEQVLLPTLTPGDIVIIDNLGSHKGAPVRRIRRAVGAKLFCCRPTAPVSARSSRSSPSSRPRCERPVSEPSRPPGSASDSFSPPSHPPSAPITSPTLDMLRNRTIPL